MELKILFASFPVLPLFWLILETMYPEDELQKLWRKQRTCGALENGLAPLLEYILLVCAY